VSAVRRSAPWCLALAAGLSATGGAQAEPQEEAVRFQYDAPAACPDAASFTARVRQRTPRGRDAVAGELARAFNVHVTTDPRGFVGTIEFLDDAGAQVNRRVGGEQCEPVVDSLALITALALDATLHAQEPTEAEIPEPAKPVAAEPVPVPLPARVAAPTAPPLRSAERWLRSARIGLLGGYDTNIEALRFGLLGQLDWRSDWSVRIAAHFAASERTVDAGRRAQLRIVGLESSGCYGLLRSDDFVVSPCVWLDLGSLRAAGQKSEQLPTARGDSIFWASAGPELRLAWEPEAPFWLELRGDLGFPLVARRFTFHEPAAPVYEVPRFTQAFGVAGGLRFW
jgi:hypothetical protein